MSRQPRFERQFIPIVRPPAIHAEFHQPTMPRPVIANVQARIGRLVNGRTKQIARGAIDVQDNLEIQIVQLLYVFRNERVCVERQ